MSTDGRPTPILEMSGVTAGYDRLTVLRDIDLAVPPGKIVALLGANGAGKTTLLRTATGHVRASTGSIRLRGEDHTTAPPHVRAKHGLCLIPEGRGVFRPLTVRENLRLQVPATADDPSIEPALVAFPILKERLDQLAGTLSGGQQQMLALSRAYLSNPAVILLDEVSMGLAPKVVDEIFEALRNLASTGAALLLVEQYVNRALDLADDVVMLDRGQIVFHGPPSTLDRETVLQGYLGHNIAVEV